MILFVFEGVKREPDLFRTIQRLYFANRDEQIVCSYNNNIYQLYKDLQEYDGDGDIVSLLMENNARHSLPKRIRKHGDTYCNDIL